MWIVPTYRTQHQTLTNECLNDGLSRMEGVVQPRNIKVCGKDSLVLVTAIHIWTRGVCYVCTYIAAYVTSGNTYVVSDAYGASVVNLRPGSMPTSRYGCSHLEKPARRKSTSLVLNRVPLSYFTYIWINIDEIVTTGRRMTARTGNEAF